jgi:hypothetical protein
MFGVGEADFFACGLSLVLHLRILWYSSCQLALFEMYDDSGKIFSNGLVVVKIAHYYLKKMQDTFIKLVKPL